MQHLHTSRNESRCLAAMSTQSLIGLPTQSAKALRRLVLLALLLSAGVWARPALAAMPAPSAPDMTDASDSGLSHFDNTTNVTQPVFTGTGTPFSTVTLYAGSTPVGYAIVVSNGKWTIAPNSKLKDGSYTMTVRQTMKGVQSAPSGSLNIEIDTVAPAFTTPSLTPECDSGMYDDDNQTNMTTLSFNGVSSPDTYISLYNMSVPGGELLGKTMANGLSGWKINVKKAFPSGTHTYQIVAKASDLAGNVSPGGTLSLGVDTDKPAAPSDIGLYSNPGGFSSSHITNWPLALFAVKAEAYTQVELYDATTQTTIDKAFADGSGIALISTPKPLLGDHLLYAVCTDMSGNQSPASSPVKFIIDTVEPTSSILTPQADAIVSAFPTVTGMATDYHGIAQVKVQLARVRKGVGFFWNGTSFVTDHNATVNATLTPGSTTWKWDTQLPKASDLDNGTYILIACSYDTAGNWGFSDTRYFTLSGSRIRSGASFAPSAGTS